ncbi:OmpA family protein [Allomuricauda sp. d1]|uniref:OmpA family protein n=1 Tax=Allomuricauda sp. d1 TaxID=3136725 RepID=UPI0031D722BB
MVRKITTIILFLLILGQLHSQNLVINGGFEEYKSCPETLSNLADDSEHLTAPTTGTTDYFNTCGIGDVAIPKNFKGEQKALEGEAYAGLHMYAPNDYREYVQMELKQSLKGGRVYQVTLNMSMAESSEVAMQEMYVLFTDIPVHADVNKNLSPPRLERFDVKKYTFVKLSPQGPLYDNDQWVKVQMEFVAKGFEKYMLLGNFKNNKNTRKISLETEENETQRKSYYYIDDVQVSYLRDTEYELNKPFVLDQLSFKFNDFELSEEAKKDIRKVYSHLKKNPKLKLIINGHTDNLGAVSYNKYLSSRRAWSVAKYLEKLGLNKTRLAWEGHGDTKPKVRADSDAAREQNRRVEFVMTEFDDE